MEEYKGAKSEFRTSTIGPCAAGVSLNFEFSILREALALEPPLIIFDQDKKPPHEEPIISSPFLNAWHLVGCHCPGRGQRRH